MRSARPAGHGVGTAARSQGRQPSEEDSAGTKASLGKKVFNSLFSPQNLLSNNNNSYFVSFYHGPGALLFSMGDLICSHNKVGRKMLGLYSFTAGTTKVHKSG